MNVTAGFSLYWYCRIGFEGATAAFGEVFIVSELWQLFKEGLIDVSYSLDGRTTLRVRFFLGGMARLYGFEMLRREDAVRRSRLDVEVAWLYTEIDWLREEID